MSPKQDSRPPKRPKPPSQRLYRQLMIEELLSYCPHVYACGWCKRPVVKGYCCRHCGSPTPESDEPPGGNAE